MKDLVSNYDYTLPQELIAQRPVPGRDGSRLLLLDRDDGALADARFSDLPGLLRAGDLLVVNDTRVLPARFKGHRESDGPAAPGSEGAGAGKPRAGEDELLLHSPGEDRRWQALVRPSRRFKPGDVFIASTDSAAGQGSGEASSMAEDAPSVRIAVEEHTGEGSRWVRLLEPEGWEEAMDLAGRVPLPPYIERPADERDSLEYQTLFARERGAVAAPTAGLHFSPTVLDELERGGVHRIELTLHVGIGTFRPPREDDPDLHVMHEELFQLPAATRRAVDATRAAGGRVVAVGTTTTRALESLSDDDWNSDVDYAGSTRLFIRPPFAFKRVDALLSNFHLPRSTLLMLVSALAGRESVRTAYAHAVAERYRFYSYGDAMLIMARVVRAAEASR